MDKKQMVIVILISMALVFGWFMLSSWMHKQHPEWFQTPKQAQPAPAQPQDPGTQPAQAGPTQPATTPTTGTRAVGGEAKPAQIGHFEYDPKGTQPYTLGLNIDPQGAALQSVTLNRFKADVEKTDPYIFQRPYEGVASISARSMITRSLLVNGNPVDLTNVTWRATATTGDSATYAVDILDPAGKTLLTLSKQYKVFPADNPNRGYEVLVTYTYENRTDQPLTVKLYFNGPTVPGVENTRDIPEAVVGYNNDGQVALDHFAGTSFDPAKPARSLKHEKGLPILWAGFVSAYFDAIVRPPLQDGKTPTLADVTASALARHAENGQAFASLTFETTDLTVPVGQPLSLPYHVYFGPRGREVLNSSHYSSFPLGYDQTLVLTSGICAWCTFQWLVNVLVWMLTGFRMVLQDWGLAIIALVVVVRLLVHPVSKKSQIEMSKMSKMGPEIERLKKKYGDNKEELNRAMMAFYKEQGSTPIMGCLPMLLQMPIWIALWSSLQSTFELRHAPFLWGGTWIDDLSQPDRLVYFPNYPINLYFFKLDAINILPIAMGVIFWVQQKMTPKPAAATPEQQQQQKMMTWMTTLLFPLLLYTGPSGLNLYILTSTAVGIWESKRVRDHLKAREQAEKEGKVIIDAKATRDSRRMAKAKQADDAKPGGLWGWWANLQQKAEQMRSNVERRGKDRK